MISNLKNLSDSSVVSQTLLISPQHSKHVSIIMMAVLSCWLRPISKAPVLMLFNITCFHYYCRHHFTDEETEVNRMTCPTSQQLLITELKSKSMQDHLQSHASTVSLLGCSYVHQFVCPFIWGSKFLDIRNQIFPLHVPIYYSSAQYYCANKQMNEGQRGSREQTCTSDKCWQPSAVSEIDTGWMAVKRSR